MVTEQDAPLPSGPLAKLAVEETVFAASPSTSGGLFPARTSRSLFYLSEERMKQVEAARVSKGPTSGRWVGDGLWERVGEIPT